ncbi:MAG: aminotransferase class V-fold PLP-dependent enzyme [Thermodesulfobacteriota bacterium]
MPKAIYCDQAATSFPKPGTVIEAVVQALSRVSASPGRSAHGYSLEASRLVFNARETVAEFLGVDDSSRIVFTLNVTQALNLALSGWLRPGDHVLTTDLEHNSVMRPLAWLSQERGVEVEVVPSGPDGLIRPREFEARRRPETRLAVVNHASNVTGAISPVQEIKAALGNVPVLLDVAQTAGCLPLPPAEQLADLIAFTGHKSLLGPTGTGGLWVGPGLELKPLVHGGTGSRSEQERQPDFMPDALEAGTPNTHGLAGLAAGIRFVLETGLDRIRSHELELTGLFLDGLSLIKGIEVYGPDKAEARVAVVSLNLDGWSPSDLALALEREYGVMVRAGLHCAPRAHRTIQTFPRGAVRFSFGWFNTPREVVAVLAALNDLARRPGP